MNTDRLVYLIFGIVLLIALVLDLGLLSKKNKAVTNKQALYQTLFWVLLALGFFVFMGIEEGRKPALEYISAYLMEWSLSVDNIFVFILIFTAFKVKEKNYSRVLLIGILFAIILRVLFITAGVAIVEKFDWVLYIFGAFLLYTGYKMFTAGDEKEFNPEENKVYLFLKKFLPLSSQDGNGKFIIREKGKPVYTTLFVVVILLASVDLVFALDSIPAVLGISRDRLVIYTSNIFAVLGLRSLFFLLRNAVNKFKYLPQSIAIVLIFIGLKMLCAHWINQWMDNSTQAFISLGMIVLCISISMILSQIKTKKKIT
jgi:tellurite resistance protein TerC